MSWKSLGLSILSLIITIGLLFACVFLFSMQAILGIIGIVLLVVIPIIIRHKALNEAKGIVDRVFAKFIIPIVTVLVGVISVFVILGLIPSPFQ